MVRLTPEAQNDLVSIYDYIVDVSGSSRVACFPNAARLEMTFVTDCGLSALSETPASRSSSKTRVSSSFGFLAKDKNFAKPTKIEAALVDCHV